MTGLELARSARIVIPVNWNRDDPQDWVIHDPLEKLFDKYFNGDTVLSREFDLYPARRSVDSSWWSRLEGADLAVTILMNSRMESFNVDRVFANQVEIEEALREIPTDLDLADANMEDVFLRRSLHRLFRAFRVEDVAVAKAAKVFCLKRPRLIPMLDQLVRKALYENEDPPASPTDPNEFADLCVDEIALFQKLLLWPVGDGKRNLDGAISLGDALAGEWTRRISNSEDVRIGITPVRVLDNLLWFEYGGYKNFGYIEDRERCLIERK